MGIIRAAVSSISGNLADQWLEVIEPGEMGPTTFMTVGSRVTTRKRGSNVKGDPRVISNGSVIHVYPNQMMLLIDSGKVIDYTAEEGFYTVNLSSAPSIFNGELKQSVTETFNRFKFGGIPSATQTVCYINLQEIAGIPFGTPNALQYFDNFYNAELFLRCHGTFSIKITDPLKFFTEAVTSGSSSFDAKEFTRKYLNEFLSALQAAIGQMSVDGIRISALSSQTEKLNKYMANVLDEDWNKFRGMEVQKVGIGSLSYDDESKALINMRNKGAMLSDPTVREGYVQGSVARGLEAAGSNTGGAAQAFMGMGMGMQGAGAFMGSATQTNMQQMQMNRQQAAQNHMPQANWQCQCGQNVSGNFCPNCGAKKPAPAGSWQCVCGEIVTGNFCQNCGAKKPAPAGSWTCSCGKENTGKFCAECGQPAPANN